MSRPYYDDYGGSIPDYYTESPPRPRPNPHSRIPRPEHAAHDRMRGPPPMRPEHHHAAAGSDPRRGQEPYYADHSTWGAPPNLYDGSGYEDEYGHYEDDYSQWPLPSQAHVPSPRNSPRRPPPRPQRPDESPQRPEHRQPVRDQPRSNRQYYAPQQMSHHGTGQWTGNGYAYEPPQHPPPSRPLPQSRGPVGPQSASPQHELPQMPQQAVYGQANRRPPLGPPPSARRGPPSYFPAAGPVHPIVEETDSMRGSTRGSARTGSAHTGGHDSKTSFASSNAIPIGIPQFYIDNGAARPSTGDRSSARDEFDDESPIEAGTGRRLDNLAESESEAAREEQPSPEVLVRQASVGKKSKPTLTTVKGGDRMRRGSSGEQGIASLPSQQHERSRDAELTAHARGMEQDQTSAGASAEDHVAREQTARNAAAVAAATEYMQKGEPTRDGAGSRTPEEILRSGTGLLDPSSSDESERDVKKKRSRELLGASIANELHPTRSRPRSPLAPDNDERVKSILESLEKGGAISAKDAEELKAPAPGLSDRAGKKRPPRINVDAVREAEARGSLTSLPDLIRRATKLASNLDRGKTASRMGMANWLDGAEGNEKRRSGSVSDILNSFPAPHNQTPRASRADMTRWSSRLRHSALPSDSDAGEKQKPRRRCCGMPLWLFLLLLLLLVLLVAAAVVVPIMLIVVPRQNDHKASSANSCENKLTCQNGGTNILSNNGFCECLCINGYTGLTCAKYEGQSCTTTSIGSASNATVGDAIPRLLEDSSSNFSIPLDGQQLLGLFSSSDMSCTSQNALVTFDGSASKRRSFIDVVVRSPTPTEVKRQADQSSSATATSSNGIVYANGSPSATPSRTSSSSAPSSTSTGIIDNSTALDFARVAVLYVFQAAADFDAAATAQEYLQDYFRQSDNNEGQTVNAANVSLGNGFTCNLNTYSLQLSNGTTVGGS